MKGGIKRKAGASSLITRSLYFSTMPEKSTFTIAVVLVSTFLLSSTNSFAFITQKRKPHLQQQQTQQTQQTRQTQQTQQTQQIRFTHDDPTWRRLIVTGLSTFLGASSVLCIGSPAAEGGGSLAHAAQQVIVSPDDITRLRRGLQEINYLLDHWDEKTTYCNYGQFKNELLSAANKDKLLEAAKEPILLYDKSATMNIMCKKDPEVVRAFLGLTKENLVLSQADILMKKPSTVDLVDPDDIEEYFSAVDQYQQANADAGSLAYQSRRDFTSTENFSKEDMIANAGKTLSGREDYLTQSKTQVVLVRDSLQTIVKALHLL